MQAGLPLNKAISNARADPMSSNFEPLQPRTLNLLSQSPLHGMIGYPQRYPRMDRPVHTLLFGHHTHPSQEENMSIINAGVDSRIPMSGAHKKPQSPHLCFPFIETSVIIYSPISAYYIYIDLYPSPRWSSSVFSHSPLPLEWWLRLAFR